MTQEELDALPFHRQQPGRSITRRALLAALPLLLATGAHAAIPRKPRRLSAALHLRLVDQP